MASIVQGQEGSMNPVYSLVALPVGWSPVWVPRESVFAFVHVPSGYVQKENPRQLRPTIASLQQTAAQNARNTVEHGADAESRKSLKKDEKVSTQQSPLAHSSCFPRLATGLLADLHPSKPEPSPVCLPQSKSDVWKEVRKWHNAHSQEQRELEVLLGSGIPLHQVMDNLRGQWDIHSFSISRQSRAILSAVTRRWFEAQTKEHQTRVQGEVEDRLSDLPPHEFTNSLPSSLIGPTFVTLRQSTTNQLAAIGSAVFQDQSALDRIEFRNPALEGQAAVRSKQDLAVQHYTIPRPSQQTPTIPNRSSSSPEHSSLDVEVSRNEGPQEASSHPSNLWSILGQTTVNSNGEIQSLAAEEATSALQNAIHGPPGRQPNASAQQDNVFSTTQQTLLTINTLSNQNASGTNGAPERSLSSQDDKGTVTLAQISVDNVGATAFNPHASMVPGIPTPPQTPLSLPFTSHPRSTPQPLFTQHLQAHNTFHGSGTSHASSQRFTGQSFPQSLQRQNTSQSQTPLHPHARRRNFTYDPVADASSQAGTTVMVNGRRHILGTQLDGPATARERTEMPTAGHSSYRRVNYQILEYHNQPSTTSGGDMRICASSHPVMQQQGPSYFQTTTTQNDQIDSPTQEDTTESTPTRPRVRLPPPAPSGPSMRAPTVSGPSMRPQGMQAFAQMASHQPQQQVQMKVHPHGSRRGQGVPGAPAGPKNHWPSRWDDRRKGSGSGGPSNPGRR